MAITGWTQPPPPATNAGFSLYGPQRPGTTGPRYHPPRAARPKPPKVHVPKAPPRPTHQVVNDPFAPLSDQQLQNMAAAQAAAIYGPQAAAIQAAIEARSRAGMAAIGGLTNQLGGLWAGVGPAEGAAYDQARAEQGRVNTELANRLNAFGGQQQAASQAALALQNAPQNVVDQVAGGENTRAQGASNANYAVGSAGLEALLAQGAAARGYGAKLPGIAGLTGLQSGRQLQAQLNQQLGQQLSQAAADRASTQSSIYQHLLDRELSKAQDRQSGLFKSTSQAETARYHKASLRYKMLNDARNLKIKQQQLGISDARLRETMRHNNQTAAQAIASIGAQNQRQRERLRDQRMRQNKWQVDPMTGQFRTRLNKKTGQRERIPIHPPKSKSSQSSYGAATSGH